MSDFRHVALLDVADVAAQIERMRVGDFDPQRDFTLPGLKHKTIFLRCHDNPSLDNWFADQPVYDWPILQGWATMQLLLDTAHRHILRDPYFGPRVNQSTGMGRAVLSVIEPDGWIQTHVDLGGYAAGHLRFHIPAVTSADAVVYVRDERERMPPGALTWLNVDKPHGAENWHPKPRTHVVFELRRAA